MDYSVVGLPHYTIWHLYEPSVDDIKRVEVGRLPVRDDEKPADVLQEMEQAKRAKEQEENEKLEKERQIKEQFGDANPQWEKDKSDMDSLSAKKKKANAKDGKKLTKPKSGTKPQSNNENAKPLEHS